MKWVIVWLSLAEEIKGQQITKDHGISTNNCKTKDEQQYTDQESTTIKTKDQQILVKTKDQQQM